MDWIEIATLALAAGLGMLWMVSRKGWLCRFGLHEAQHQEQAFLRWPTRWEASQGIEAVMTLERRVKCRHCTSGTAWHSVQTMRIGKLENLDLSQYDRLRLELQHRLAVGDTHLVDAADIKRLTS